MRIKLLNFAIISLFILLGLGNSNLSVIQGCKFKELSDKNCIRLLPQPGARGRILDRNGQVLVDNTLSFDVMILPQDKPLLDKTLLGISKILDVKLDDLKAKFKSGYSSSFLPVCIGKNIDIKKVIALEELKSDLSGIIIQPHPLRHYPYGSLACHLIGYLNEIDRLRLTKLADYDYHPKDIVGFGGVEERYDYFIRPKEGALSVEVDHLGRFIRVLSYKPAQNGKDIQLTLDLRIQKIVEANLGERKGSVIVIEPYTGEIFALASNPNFNPNIFINKSVTYLSGLFKDPDAPLLNRSTSGVYPPGSIFKPIVAAAALETNKINLVTKFFCSGGINIGRRQFACWNIHQQQNLREAITHSCNVFFYRTGLLLGAQTIHDFSLKFGLSKTTGIDLPYEASGFVPHPLWKKVSKFANWYDGDTANLSIGQGDLLVTPLQITRMTTCFANGGILITPYVVKNIIGNDISISHRKPIKINIKEPNLNYIRQGLSRVVSDPEGTSHVLADLAIGIAGKTGTAQVLLGQPHAWFAGYFPIEKPKFVICVFLEHGGSGYAACILTKQIIEMMLQEGLV